MGRQEEPVVGHTEATQPMPIVGETVVLMDKQYRCVSVVWVDSKETGSMPELRVRFRQERS
jgi:hypothetical protein